MKRSMFVSVPIVLFFVGHVFGQLGGPGAYQTALDQQLPEIHQIEMRLQELDDLNRDENGQVISQQANILIGLAEISIDGAYESHGQAQGFLDMYYENGGWPAYQPQVDLNLNECITNQESATGALDLAEEIIGGGQEMFVVCMDPVGVRLALDLQTTVDITSGSYTGLPNGDELGTFDYTIDNQSGDTLWAVVYVWENNIVPPATNQHLVRIDKFTVGQGETNMQSNFTASETGADPAHVMYQDLYEVQVMLFRDDNGEPGGPYPGPGPKNHIFASYVCEFAE